MKFNLHILAPVFAVIAMLTSCEKELEPDATITPRLVSMENCGGKSVFHLECNTTWTATCEDEGVIIEPASGDGDATVTVTVPPSTYIETHDIIIKVVAKQEGSSSSHVARHIITLDSKPFILLSQESGYVSPDGGGIRFGITSNGTWTATISDAIAGMTVTPASATWNSDVTVSLPANTTGAARRSKVVFTLTDHSDVAAEFTVNQNFK